MRYFIVFYIRTANGFVAYGNHAFELNLYPNREHILRIISQERHTDPSNIVITNIIELKEKDYQEWIR